MKNQKDILGNYIWANDWYENLTVTQRFELMKKHDFKNPTSKTIQRIFKHEHNIK